MAVTIVNVSHSVQKVNELSVLNNRITVLPPLNFILWSGTNSCLL
jgi:hypothetical protein